MSEVLDFYQQQAQKESSGFPWLAELQEKGRRELINYGFPSRNQEEWKYTSLDSLLKQRFECSKAYSAPRSELSLSLPFDQNLRIVNGLVQANEKLASQLPEGVLVLSLAEGLAKYTEKLKPYLGNALRHEHGFQALNTAMLGCGVFIYLPAGVQVQQPIVLSYQQDQSNQALYNRCLIVAEEGSAATILEHYYGVDNCNYFTNTVTEVFAAAQAKVEHFKIQQEGKAAYHIGQISVRQAKGSQFNSHSLSLGGKLARSDLALFLQEERARCLLNGIYAPNEGQHIDHHTTVHHLVPYCQSEQDYKGILNGRSRAVFNGKVIVAKDAQHTEAKQQNKNLLLSPQAEIDTKPQLEIFADDVVCTHGATVGQLDAEALFYLAARGIDQGEASRYLVQAFASDNLRLVSNKTVADWMAALLNEQLR